MQLYTLGYFWGQIRWSACSSREVGRERDVLYTLLM
jgi:hypothetical protein